MPTVSVNDVPRGLLQEVHDRGAAGNTTTTESAPLTAQHTGTGYSGAQEPTTAGGDRYLGYYPGITRPWQTSRV